MATGTVEGVTQPKVDEGVVVEVLSSILEPGVSPKIGTYITYTFIGLIFSFVLMFIGGMATIHLVVLLLLSTGLLVSVKIVLSELPALDEKDNQTNETDETDKDTKKNS